MSQEEKFHHLNLEATFGDMSAEDVIKMSAEEPINYTRFQIKFLSNAKALLSVANRLLNARDRREARLPGQVRSMLKEQQEIVNFFNDLYRPYLEDKSLGQLRPEDYLND